MIMVMFLGFDSTPVEEPSLDRFEYKGEEKGMNLFNDIKTRF